MRTYKLFRIRDGKLYPLFVESWTELDHAEVEEICREHGVEAQPVWAE